MRVNARNSHIVWHGVKWLFIVSIFFYLGRAAYLDGDAVKASWADVRLGYLALSLPFALLYLVLRSAIWHCIARRLVSTLPLRDDMLAWLCTNLGKYLPGKIFCFLGLAYFYGKRGVTAEKVALCCIVEVCVTVLAAAILSAAVIADAYEKTPLGASIMLPVLIVIVVSHPATLRFGVRIYNRISKRAAELPALTWAEIWVWTMMMTGAWLVLGVGFFLVIRAIAPVPVSSLLQLTGAFSIAGVAGTLSVFAPSGIGVREGVLAATMGGLLPLGVITTVVLFCRLWSTVADLICGGVAFMLIDEGSGLRPGSRE